MAKYLCFDIAEPLLNAIFDCNFANLNENGHPSLGFRVFFRVLIVVVLLLSASSFAKLRNDPSSKCPDESAEITAWLFADERCANTVEHQSHLIETFHTSKNTVDSISRKGLLYKVCTKKIDGDTLFYPCFLDSKTLTVILKNLNTKNSLKGMETKVKRISYATNVIATASASAVVPLRPKGGVLDVNNRYGEYAQGVDFSIHEWDKGLEPKYSNLYLNEDGSYETLCASADGKKCDFLYASVEIGNKIIPRKRSWSKTWGARQFDVPVEKDSKNVDLSLVLNDAYDSYFLKPLNKETRDSLIPFEMCFKDSVAVPCNLSATVVDSVRKIIEGRGDSIMMFTYQHFSWTKYQFFLGSVVNEHQCLSSDGKTCDELYVLVRWNDSYMKKAKSQSDNVGTYRFKLNDFSFVEFHDIVSDVLEFDKLKIFKKNGIRVGK